MTVKDLKKELEYYDDDQEIVFEVCGDITPESVTTNKYGYTTVYLNNKLRVSFMSDCLGDMRIELEVVEDE